LLLRTAASLIGEAARSERKDGASDCASAKAHSRAHRRANDSKANATCRCRASPTRFLEQSGCFTVTAMSCGGRKAFDAATAI
jgi:hypothetical protein